MHGHLPDGTPVLAERLRERAIAPPPVCRVSCSRGVSGSGPGLRRLRRRAAPVGRQDRTATEVTDAALAELDGSAAAPLFLWVHYWDPHHPYTPPEPFRSAHPKSPYLGEVAYMDAELGRLARGVRAPREGAVRPSSSSATTARGWATTAKRSTGTCSTSRRCACRW